MSGWIIEGQINDGSHKWKNNSAYFFLIHKMLPARLIKKKMYPSWPKAKMDLSTMQLQKEVVSIQKQPNCEKSVQS